LERDFFSKKKLFFNEKQNFDASWNAIFSKKNFF